MIVTTNGTEEDHGPIGSTEVLTWKWDTTARH